MRRICTAESRDGFFNPEPGLTRPRRAQLRPGYSWELDLRAATDGTWRTVRAENGSRRITAAGLTPGTKYVFRARAGAAPGAARRAATGSPHPECAPPAAAAPCADAGSRSWRRRRGAWLRLRPRWASSCTGGRGA